MENNQKRRSIRSSVLMMQQEQTLAALKDSKIVRDEQKILQKYNEDIGLLKYLNLKDVQQNPWILVNELNNQIYIFVLALKTPEESQFDSHYYNFINQTKDYVDNSKINIIIFCAGASFSQQNKCSSLCQKIIAQLPLNYVQALQQLIIQDISVMLKSYLMMITLKLDKFYKDKIIYRVQQNQSQILNICNIFLKDQLPLILFEKLPEYLLAIAQKESQYQKIKGGLLVTKMRQPNLEIDPIQQIEFGKCLNEYKSIKEQHIPEVVYTIIDYFNVHPDAIKKEGIFRVTGGYQEIEFIEQQLKQGNLEKIYDQQSPLVVADLLKKFLRKLKNPIIPTQLNEKFTLLKDSHHPIQDLKTIIDELDIQSYQTLEFICIFLNKISQQNTINKMNLQNIAVIFVPCLFRYQEDDHNTKQVNIMNEHYLFIKIIPFLLLLLENLLDIFPDSNE